MYFSVTMYLFVFVQPLAHSLEEMKEGIVSAMSKIDGDMLRRVWDEVDSRFDVRRVTQAYIEHL